MCGAVRPTTKRAMEENVKKKSEVCVLCFAPPQTDAYARPIFVRRAFACCGGFFPPLHTLFQKGFGSARCHHCEPAQALWGMLVDPTLDRSINQVRRPERMMMISIIRTPQGRGGSKASIYQNMPACILIRHTRTHHSHDQTGQSHKPKKSQ